MAVNGVLRLGEAAIRVLDMDAALRHYDDRLGLHQTLRDDAGRVYLKTWDEHDHHSLVLREADAPGLDYFAMKVRDDAALAGLETRLRERGVEVERIAAGTYPKSGRRIQFVLPSGHPMQLYAEKEQIGNTLGTRNPGVVPDEGVIRGLRINRLDHILLGGPKLDETVRLFCDVLDFSLSEKLVDHESGASLAVFLTCSNKPHDVALVLQPEPNRFHHVSFLLESTHDVVHAADVIGKHRIRVDVGPNRHGITRGATIYFFDPSGNRNEVFAGGYVHYPDTPTLVWDTTELGNATFAHDNTPRESFMNVLT
jgi:catechol 2,3-dioxygenase